MSFYSSSGQQLSELRNSGEDVDVQIGKSISAMNRKAAERRTVAETEARTMGQSQNLVTPTPMSVRTMGAANI